MQTIKKILVVFPLIFTTNLLIGQDIHFSQYFNSPLILNPAQAGNFEGDWRAIVNYRDQWSALSNFPYRTAAASYDRQLSLYQQHFSVGGYIMDDRSGAALLKTDKVFLSGAFHKTINNHDLTAGLQIGYAIETLDQYSLPENFNSTSGLFEKKSEGDRLSYLDVNLGFNWRRKVNRFDLEGGLAFFHLNHPKESFFDDRSSRTPIRSVLNASAKTDLSSNLYVQPGFMLYALRGSRDLMLGSQAGFSVLGNRLNVREIYGGLYFRATDPADALIAMLGVKIQKFAINFSYDVNVSSLKTYTNSRGAFEISIIYTSISTIIKTFTIPCERI